MKSIIKYQPALIIIIAFLLCVFLFTKCINNQKAKEDALISNSKFVGSTTCASCHKNIYNSHIKTAHFLTSQIATAQNVQGSFDEGKNSYAYPTGGMIKMLKKDSAFFQVAYINGVEKKREQYDIVIGSGTKGKSYASWQGKNLVQLPITYFTNASQWCNSPGYPNKISFNRPITSRCLECHATNAEIMEAPNNAPEVFNKNSLVLGVDCERCHGAAEKHVAYQTLNPTDTTAKFITNISKFARQQSLDMCALCHGGRLQKTKPSFSFKAGDNLTDYFAIDEVPQNVNAIDVHGNQYGLLKASKCFLNSQTLTCITCHNSHENEQGKNETFAARCLNCHNQNHEGGIVCKMQNALGDKINKDCTSCHMPQQPSMAIAVMLQGNPLPTPALMHTHLIKSYPEETKKVLAFINSK